MEKDKIRDYRNKEERRLLEKMTSLRYVHMAQLIILAGIVALIVLNFSTILNYLAKLISVLNPLLLGVLFAFILNIPMVFIEKHYFKNNKALWVKKSRRIVSLLLSLIIVLGVIIVTITLAVPQLSNAGKIIIEKFPKIFDEASNWVGGKLAANPIIAQRWENFSQNSESFIQNIVNKSGGIVEGVFSFTLNALGGVFTFIFGLMFAIYMLISKESLLDQAKKISRAYLSAYRRERMGRVLSVVNETFSGYLTGQMVEALVIGIITTIALMILRFPFPTMIGTLTGLTTFIPILGAYAGGVIGFLMILTVDPIKALFFIVFIVLLQQIDGNFIYPRIVGNSVGMPALWVLVAVLLGGGLFGIVGALLAVPTFATLYKLLKMDIQNKLSLQKESSNGRDREKEKDKDKEEGEINLGEIFKA